MEKSLKNSSYQHLPGLDPENSEKGGWDTCPLASYINIETFYCSENSIKINRGYYTVARRYEFYFRVAKQYFSVLFII